MSGQETCHLTAEAGEEQPGPQRSDGRRRGLAAGAAVLLAVGALALMARSRSGAAVADSGAAARGEGEALWGTEGGPALDAKAIQDFKVGAYPKYEDPAAHWGTPPRPPTPQLQQMSGCPGKSCNGGNLCCGDDALCCGTSCCSKGSICCSESLGLCCSEGSMCCYGMMCCSESYTCGITRSYSDGLKWQILKACGGGGEIRRLSTEWAYRRQMQKIAVMNETGIRNFIGEESRK